MMKELFKVTEFQSASGHWHVGNFSHVGLGSSRWYVIPRLLNIPLDKYIILLREYHATIESWTEYDKGEPPFLYYYWSNYQDAHKFLLMVNREARAKNIFISF